MKQYIVTAVLLLFIVFFIPWLTAESTSQVAPEQPEQSGQSDMSASSPAPEDPATESVPTGERDSSRRLRIKIGGVVQEMDMGTYLVGVVRAEMPAVFESEALKAQAVAARTYTLYKMEHGGSANHPDADACDDITCCKAYKDAESAAAEWGESAAEYEEKLRAAVRDTDGECILYGGEPILAVFHSSSAGATMDAADVWSESLPYLTSVSSPESDETVPNYHTSHTFQVAVLREILQKALPDADLSASPTDWFTNIRQNTNGAVTSLDVGGTEVSGNRLRTILGLRSPCFTIAFEGDSVTFSVTGYGHGVGMSQYGANVLAAGGMDYREILAWYYTDTTVGEYLGEN